MCSWCETLFFATDAFRFTLLPNVFGHFRDKSGFFVRSVRAPYFDEIKELRLPSTHGLHEPLPQANALLQFRTPKPTLYTAYFTSTKQRCVWSATRARFNTRIVRILHLCDGPFAPALLHLIPSTICVSKLFSLCQ